MQALPSFGSLISLTLGQFSHHKCKEWTVGWATATWSYWPEAPRLPAVPSAWGASKHAGGLLRANWCSHRIGAHPLANTSCTALHLRSSDKGLWRLPACRTGACRINTRAPHIYKRSSDKGLQHRAPTDPSPRCAEGG